MKKNVKGIEKIKAMLEAKAPFMDVAKAFNELAVQEHLKPRDEFDQDAFDCFMTCSFVATQIAIKNGETKPLTNSELNEIKSKIIANIRKEYLL